MRLRISESDPIRLSILGGQSVTLGVFDSVADLSVTDDGLIGLKIGDLSGVSLHVGDMTAISSDPYYGPYEFTPTQEAQTVQIRNKTASANITINPIPQNYGLITYNGATITVS